MPKLPRQLTPTVNPAGGGQSFLGISGAPQATNLASAFAPIQTQLNAITNRVVAERNATIREKKAEERVLAKEARAERRKFDAKQTKILQDTQINTEVANRTEQLIQREAQFTNRKGIDAVNNTEDYQASIRKVFDTSCDNVEDPAVCEGIRSGLSVAYFSASKKGFSHLIKQNQEASENSVEAALNVLSNAAASSGVSPEIRSGFLSQGTSIIAKHGESMGWSPAEVKDKSDDFVSGVNEGVVKMLLAAKATEHAWKYLIENKGAIKPGSFTELLSEFPEPDPLKPYMGFLQSPAVFSAKHAFLLGINARGYIDGDTLDEGLAFIRNLKRDKNINTATNDKRLEQQVSDLIRARGGKLTPGEAFDSLPELNTYSDKPGLYRTIKAMNYEGSQSKGSKSVRTNIYNAHLESFLSGLQKKEENETSPLEYNQSISKEGEKTDFEGQNELLDISVKEINTQVTSGSISKEEAIKFYKLAALKVRAESTNRMYKGYVANPLDLATSSHVVQNKQERLDNILIDGTFREVGEISKDVLFNGGNNVNAIVATVPEIRKSGRKRKEIAERITKKCGDSDECKEIEIDHEINRMSNSQNVPEVSYSDVSQLATHVKRLGGLYEDKKQRQEYAVLLKRNKALLGSMPRSVRENFLEQLGFMVFKNQTVDVGSAFDSADEIIAAVGAREGGGENAKKMSTANYLLETAGTKIEKRDTKAIRKQKNELKKSSASKRGFVDWLTGLYYKAADLELTKQKWLKRSAKAADFSNAFGGFLADTQSILNGTSDRSFKDIVVDSSASIFYTPEQLDDMAVLVARKGSYAFQTESETDIYTSNLIADMQNGIHKGMTDGQLFGILPFVTESRRGEVIQTHKDIQNKKGFALISAEAKRVMSVIANPLSESAKTTFLTNALDILNQANNRASVKGKELSPSDEIGILQGYADFLSNSEEEGEPDRLSEALLDNTEEAQYLNNLMSRTLDVNRGTRNGVYSLRDKINAFSLMVANIIRTRNLQGDNKYEQALSIVEAHARDMYGAN